MRVSHRVSVRTGGPALPGRPRLLLPVVVTVLVVIVAIGVFVNLYTDLLWFREARFATVFSTVLRTRLLLFAMFGLLMAAVVGINLVVAYRSRPPFRPLSLEQQNLERYRVAIEPYLTPSVLLVSGVFGLFAGLSASARWQTWLLWRNRTPFGVKDLEFGKDVSYFTFTYPMQRFALGFALTVFVLSLLVAAITHYLFGGVRLQTEGEKVSPAARAHLSVLIGVIVLLKGAAYYLDRYGLAFSLRGRVQGPGYTDVHAVLPAKTILVGIAIICALLFFANIVVRNILLPGGALALLVISAIGIGGIYPAIVQQTRVKPNEIVRERTYIERNIATTRAAYQIDKVVTEPYSGVTTTALATLAKDTGTLPKARLLDPNVLSRTYTQLQRLRAYYGFKVNLNIDRYDFGKGVQDAVVGVRELNKDGLSIDQQNWINEHLVYTHGNGIVAAPANTVDSSGRPVFTVKDLPVTGPIPIEETRIYYGEGTTDYSIVNTSQAETDGPVQGGKEATYSYKGNGGIALDSPLRKLLYALKFKEKNLLLSSALTPTSKLMYIRTPKERVQKVAPFLQLDGDPYPAVVDGRILWIIDGYTTSANYPYSERTTLGTATLDSQTVNGLPDQEVNYIRNSVKATVDAFTGKVTLYDWDAQDPVLQTWDKAFGGKLFQPKSAMSPSLLAHVRYPEDLFKVQRNLLTKYHITDPKAFFQGDDYWQIPSDPTSNGSTDPATTAQQLFSTSNNGPDQPPYYVELQPPGTTTPRFALTTSFVARNGQNLTAFASVSSDPSDYGQLRLLELPNNTVVSGPVQAASLFASTTQISQDLNLLNRGNSRVVLGNLLTLPIGGGLLYLEPVYVEGTQKDSYPTLRYVIAAYGDKIAFTPTLSAALQTLFGGNAGTIVPPPVKGGTTPPPTGTATQAQAIADALAANIAGQAALKAGDFAEYGRQQALLTAALDRLKATSSTISVPPSSVPAPSPSATR